MSEAKQHRMKVHYSTHTKKTPRHTDTKTKHAHKTTEPKEREQKTNHLHRRKGGPRRNGLCVSFVHDVICTSWTVFGPAGFRTVKSRLPYYFFIIREMMENKTNPEPLGTMTYAILPTPSLFRARSAP